MAGGDKGAARLKDGPRLYYLETRERLKGGGGSWAGALAPAGAGPRAAARPSGPERAARSRPPLSRSLVSNSAFGLALRSLISAAEKRFGI